MEEDQEVIKHVCKICSKSFSCGRSLGGHMRSHDHDHGDGEFVVAAATSATMKKVKNEGCSEGYYGLRENPKKTWRVLNDSTIDEDSFDVVLDKLCKECGKGFQSMKALFGHMKCHSDKALFVQKKKSFELDEQEESNGNGGGKKINVQSDDTDATVLPNRKRRSKRRLRTRYINSGNNSCSVVSFAANSVSEEEVAMILIMLSRDVRPWCGFSSIVESSDNNDDHDHDDDGDGDDVDDDNENSLESEAPLTHLVSKIEEKKRVTSNGSEIVKVTKKPKKLDFSNIVSPNVKSKGKSLEIFGNESEGNDGLMMKKTKIITKVSVIENGKDKKKEKMKHEVDSDSGFEVNDSNTKYTSMKVKFFDSETKVTSKGESSKRKFECVTCNRIFPSYQALGGHRASHKRTKGCGSSRIDQSSENENNAEMELEVDMKIKVNAEGKMLENERVLVNEEAHEIRNFLDLNLPAATIHEERNGHSEIYKPCWIVGRNLKQEAMSVGLLSN